MPKSPRQRRLDRLAAMLERIDRFFVWLAERRREVPEHAAVFTPDEFPGRVWQRIVVANSLQAVRCGQRPNLRALKVIKAELAEPGRI